jgi:hypothetical protein
MPKDVLKPSDPVTKRSSRSIQVHNGGVTMNWKMVLGVILTLLVGGGGYGTFQFVTQDQLDKAIADQTEKHEIRHVKIDEKFDKTQKAITINSTVINKAVSTIEAVQRVQHRAVARGEARRLTEDIGDRRKREEKYDALLDLNMARLKRGVDPCANLNCSN